MKRLTLFLILLSGILCARAQESADSLAQPAVLTAPEQLAEASPDQLWDRANTAYINGDYHVAAEFYDQILARGLSSMKLYYNLANAYFKEGSWVGRYFSTTGLCGWLPATTTFAIT